MKTGTKSILIGAHQFALHPALIAIGWWKAYGWRRVWIGDYSTPDYLETMDGRRWATTCLRSHYASFFDPRLWLAFVVHDLGYWGKANMDDADGETHPELGARFMRRMFGDAWGDLILCHSRYYAKRLGRDVSPLCFADKWVILLEPSWLYLPRVRLSGELKEFLDVAYKRSQTFTENDPLSYAERRAFASGHALTWHKGLKAYMRRWIEAHIEGTADTWTRARHMEARN